MQRHGLIIQVGSVTKNKARQLKNHLEKLGFISEFNIMPRAKSPDPKRNAGISLTGAEIEKLAKFAETSTLEGKSAVVALLIQKYLPSAWWDLELEKGRK